VFADYGIKLARIV